MIYEHEERVLDWTDPAWEALDLQPGQVIYTASDESGHLFVNDARDTLYVVDVGCPALAMGVDKLIKDSSQITQTYVFITHLHVDHHQAL
jgi:glyoxylase-like metal-dependent hydrolase (beta-lactamase superfamily II)